MLKLRKIQTKKEQMKITHLKTMEQQSTHPLKSNPKFWSFTGNHPKFWGREAPWLPFIKIEVEKSLSRPQFKIEIDKPLNHPRFGGREALWLSFIKIEVEKPLGHPQFKIKIKKPHDCPRFQGKEAHWSPTIQDWDRKAS